MLSILLRSGLIFASFLMVSSSTLLGVTSEEAKAIVASPVVISATKYPSQLDQTGDTVRVITSDELSALGVGSLQEALSLVANVHISSSYGVSSIFNRGTHSGSTPIQLNGVSLFDPLSTNGAPFFLNIPLQAVERIEFVSGSKSTLHGSGATGGMINIITPETATDDGVVMELGQGQFNVQGNYPLQVGNHRLLVNGYLERNHSGSAVPQYNGVDFDEIDQINAQTFSVYWRNPDLFTGQMNGYYQFNFMDQDLDKTSYDDPNYTSQIQQHLTRFDYSKPLSGQQFLNINYSRNALHRHYENLKDNADEDTELNDYHGLSHHLDMTHLSQLNHQQTLLLGLDIAQDQGRQSTDYSGDKSEISDQQQSATSLYTQFRFLNPVLSTQLGARFTNYHDQKTVQTASASFFRKVPLIGATATLSFRTGYRNPTLYERFDPTYGNDSLKAESSESQELSLQKSFRYAAVKLTHFNHLLDSKITGTAENNYKNTNINGLSRSVGQELSIQVPRVGWLQFLRLDMSQVDSKEAGKNALKVPEHKVTLSTGLQYQRALLGISMHHVGSQFASASSSLPSYSFANLNLSYTLSQKHSMGLKIENITNEFFQMATNNFSPGRTALISYSLAL
ncbi:MAG: hypothetical protein CL521_02065 [Actinobacteria bacterium]|nr:hypothetical protein [Actinomycetota bacterium]